MALRNKPPPGTALGVGGRETEGVARLRSAREAGEAGQEGVWGRSYARGKERVLF